MIKSTFSWINPKLEIKNTEKYGKGTFAMEIIKKGERLFIFGGHIMSREEEETLPEKIRDIAIQIDKNFVIGPNTIEELSDTDYVNHSCSPNSGIKGQITLVAMKDIESGEEITFDYGTVLFVEENKPIYELQCSCNSKDCRKKITQMDWKIPELQQKYKGFFPYYIQEEIDKLKQ